MTAMKETYRRVRARGFRERFEFMYAYVPGSGRFRRILHSPDIIEPRFNVFDTQEKKTIGWGPTQAAAVDSAIHNSK